MRIALLGTRGIPANYGGFETFAEELSVRLAERGHDVTVYCRAPHHASEYRGVRLRYLPTIRHKYLDTVAHTALSTFDLLMRRFDALQPYKTALEVLRRELPGQPLTTLCAGASLLRSMRWMLEAADIPTDGVCGAVAVRLATAAYLSAMRVWQRDESAALARTMATLDARLRRVERWLVPARAARNGGEPVPA